MGAIRFFFRLLEGGSQFCNVLIQIVGKEIDLSAAEALAGLGKTDALEARQLKGEQFDGVLILFRRSLEGC